MKLRLGSHNSYRTSDYGSEKMNYVFNESPLHEFMGKMMKGPPQGLITTKISDGSWFKNPEHILAADLDGEQAYTIGSECLSQSGIDYAVVESTPGRYWVFCDKVGTFDEHHAFLTRMPGVDAKWLDKCKPYKNLMFRAFPKVPGYPLFRGKPIDVSTVAGEWFYQYRAYFTSHEYIALHDKLFGAGLQNIPWLCEVCNLKAIADRTSSPVMQIGLFCKTCGNERNHPQSVARRYEEAKPMVNVKPDQARELQAIRDDWGY